jgi:CheY-like chemotaxis protein
MLGASPTVIDDSLRHAWSAKRTRKDCGAADLSGIKILVVDDQADARDLIGQILTHCGAKVLPAASAEEALSLFKKERPDVIVTDIGMPDMDGFELLRKLRALEHDRTRDIPAIAVTAFARPEDRARAMSAGFAAYLSKPIDISELLGSIAGINR